MKKLLPLLTLLALPLMAGCAPNQTFVDEHIITVLEDLTLNSMETEEAGQLPSFGKANFSVINEDEIFYFYTDGDVSIAFDIYIEEKMATKFLVWSYGITYENVADGIVIYFEFMHYDEWFVVDYKPETINMNHRDYAIALTRLTNNDLVYLLKQLESFI